MQNLFFNNTPKAILLKPYKPKLIFPMKDFSRTYSTKPDVSFLPQLVVGQKLKRKGKHAECNILEENLKCDASLCGPKHNALALIDPCQPASSKQCLESHQKIT